MMISKPGFYFIQRPTGLTVAEAFYVEQALMIRVIGLHSTFTPEQYADEATAVGMICSPVDEVTVAPDGALYINGMRMPFSDGNEKQLARNNVAELLGRFVGCTLTQSLRAHLLETLLDACRYPHLYHLTPENARPYPPVETQRELAAMADSAAADAVAAHDTAAASAARSMASAVRLPTADNPPGKRGLMDVDVRRTGNPEDAQGDEFEPA